VVDVGGVGRVGVGQAKRLVGVVAGEVGHQRRDRILGHVPDLPARGSGRTRSHAV